MGLGHRGSYNWNKLKTVTDIDNLKLQSAWKAQL